MKRNSPKNEPNKKGLLQNSLKKLCIKIGPREKQNRFSRGPIFIACFEFLVQIAIAFLFLNNGFCMSSCF